MNPDPLESLNAFYEECRHAPVPPTQRPQPRRFGWLLAPAAGLAFGALIAGLIVAPPPLSRRHSEVQAARAIVRRQMAASAAAILGRGQG